jgi:hypothetical protein
MTMSLHPRILQLKQPPMSMQSMLSAILLEYARDMQRNMVLRQLVCIHSWYVMLPFACFLFLTLSFSFSLSFSLFCSLFIMTFHYLSLSFFISLFFALTLTLSVGCGTRPQRQSHITLFLFSFPFKVSHTWISFPCFIEDLLLLLQSALACKSSAFSCVFVHDICAHIFAFLCIFYAVTGSLFQLRNSPAVGLLDSVVL